MCNHKCEECAFPDCICDDVPTQEELKAIDRTDYEIRKQHAIDNGTLKFFKYNNSEKGKARRKRYYQTDKGKEAQKRYRMSEKGKENIRRNAEIQRLKRIQQKGEMQWQM